MLQKKIIRIIVGVKPRTSTGPLFDRLKCLTCTNINKYLIGRLMLKIHNDNDKAHMFAEHFSQNCRNSCTWYQTKSHYHIPPFKTNLGKNSLRYTGAVLWNEVLKVGLNPETRDYSFAKGLESVLLDHLLWSRYLCTHDYKCCILQFSATTQNLNCSCFFTCCCLSYV